MSHAYVVTAQPATAAMASIVCSFTGSNSRDLVLAKGSHIEVHRLSEASGSTGLQLAIDVNFYGKIVSIDKYRPTTSSDQDYLFVLTERKNFCVLRYDASSKSVKTISAGNVKDKVGRDIASGLCGIVDNQHHIVSMLVYEGLLKVFPIDPLTGTVKECFNLRLEEIRFIDLKFLSGYDRPTFALLYEDGRQNKHVKTYSIDLKEKELTAGPWCHMYVDRSSLFMIPEPCERTRSASAARGGGVVLVGMNMVSFNASTNAAPGAGTSVAPHTIALQSSTRFLSYGNIDADGSRYLLGDVYGTLYVLVLKRQLQSSGGAGPVTVGLALEPLGTTSVAAQLCYLSDGLVYVNSRMGDSQLIRLNNKPARAMSEGEGDAPGSYVSTLETFTNVGPIVDMVVVETHPEQEGGGSTSTAQVQVVTCSGAYKDGSLRIVKSGIGMREQASMEIPGIRGMWSLCPGSGAAAVGAEMFDEYLVQAFISETRILRITSDEMEECEIPGFSSDETTLYCGNMCGNSRWLQVTPTRVSLVDCASLQVVAQFVASSCPEPQDRFAVVTANQQQITVATAAGHLLTFEVEDGSRLVQKGAVKLEYDIACLSMRPINTSVVTADAGASMDCDGGSAPEAMSSSVSPVPVASPGTDSSSCHFAVRVLDGAAAQAAGRASVSSLVSPDGKATLLAVGLWSDNSVRLFALPSLVEVTRVSLGSSSGGGGSGGGSAASSSVGAVAQVRDVLLVDLSPTLVTLLAGMGDGTLISYTVECNGASDAPTLAGRRVVALGTQPISLSCFTNNGRLYALACCDHPTVIYEQNNKLLFSIVNTTGGSSNSKPSRMVSFHTEMFPEGLAVSSDEGLSITTVGEIRKIHVQKHSLGESPRRICYCSENQVYTVLTQKITVHPVDKVESSIDRVLFMRENGGASGVGNDLMSTVHVHELDPMESAMSCASCSLCVDDASAGGAIKQYVVVGTAQTIVGEVEPSRGRILVFDISSSHAAAADSMDTDGGSGAEEKTVVTLIYEKEVRGAVFSLACLKGRLVAGVGSKIQMYKLNLLHQRPELKHECSHYGHILTLAVKAQGDLVLVGDLLRSITVLRYSPASASENGVLVEVARDFHVNSMRAVEFFHSGEFYLGAEDFGNIFITKRQMPAASSGAPSGGENAGGVVGGTLTAEEKGRLLIHSEYHVGDTINTLRPGSLNVQPKELQQQQPFSSSSSSSSSSNAGPDFSSAAALPENQSILYGTVNGAIGSILSIPTPMYEFFSALEAAIRSVVQGVGGFSHAEYRALFNGRRNGSQSNSVDGDLVEMFLVLAPADMERIVVCLNNGIRARKANSSAIPRGISTAVGTGSLTDVQRGVLSGAAWSTVDGTESDGDAVAQGREFTVEDVVARIEEMLRLH